MNIIDVQPIIETIKRIIDILVNNFPELATSNGLLKKGGYVSIFSIGTKRLEHSCQIGTCVPQEKWTAYSFNSEEKGTRLLASHEYLGHMTSHESRNPENNEWGGAIVADAFILSFSGLPEQADEAVMLIVAFELGLLSIIDASDIARSNNNEIFFALESHLYGE